MILQALYDCYERMAGDGRFEIARPGYSSQNVSFAIVLDEEGSCKAVLDLREGKRGRQLVVPLQKGRSGKNPPPYFLCENSKYFCGAVYDKRSDALEACEKNLAAAAELHEIVLQSVDDAGARAVLRFFARRLKGEPLDIDRTHDFYSGGFAALRLDGDAAYLHERPQVRAAWERWQAQASAEEGGARGQCLLTGEEDVPIARTHTLTKGVLGGKATGGSLVGFNFPAVESYGKSQSYNAPVSEAAMFRYTTALNALLARQENRLILGDMTCVFWTEKEVCGNVVECFRDSFAGEIAQPEVELALGGYESTEQIARILLRAICGNALSDEQLKVEEGTTVYILGLAPNAARLVVRFWYKDTFGHFTAHLAEHFADMEIVRSEKAKPFVTLREILSSMAVAGKSDNVPKSMERSVLESVVTGREYPQGLLANLLIRIRAEAGEDFAVNRTRAGLIKAILKRKYRKQKSSIEGEITVALNETTTNVPYVLGRLFAVLERLQESAGSKNLREKYFAAASTTPQVVFTSVLKLAQSHLSKVSKEKPKLAGYYDKLCCGILDKLEATGFPATLEMEEQGLFILGYYHQRQYFYTPKAERDSTQPEADAEEKDA